MKAKRNYFQLIFCLLVLVISASEAKVKIALWGDSRENKDSACENIASILLNDITDWDFQIHTGDFTSHGTEADWQRTLNYAGVDSLFMPGKFFMCTSNHDDVQSTYDKYTAGILPVNSVDGTTHFYHYQRGNVHVVACDAYFTAAMTMNNWLDTTLAKIPEDDWLIGVWHNPCYGDLTYKNSYLDKCASWLEKFHKHGGDFIFHGHAHVYVRSHPLLADGTVDHDSGMIHIVNGCGGASWREPQEYVDKTACTPNETSFACITFITLDEDTAFIQTVDARPGKNLEVFDEFRWIKSASFDINMNIDTPDPGTLKLYQNSPNPFNSSTAIHYDNPQSGNLELSIYDVNGHRVRTIWDGFQKAGFYPRSWDGRDSKGQSLPGGFYICRLRASENVKAIKMQLVK